MRAATTTPEVVVYWRPGCVFCRQLLRRLDRAGIDHTKIDIWESREAAAFVRSVADGNETVPTVTVGGSVMVNPSLAAVAAAIDDAGASRR